jgi:hypothetical protein
MKKLVVLLALAGSFVTGFAQSEKYTKAMEKNIALIDSAMRNPAQLTELAATFERIGDAEKTQWLPHYYAAYCHVMGAMMNKEKGDELADKAEAQLNKAEALQKDNSEIQCIRSMIASAHMMVDPMNRWMQYGQASEEALQKAMKLDAANPRPLMLKGQGLLYTPEQFGGGKAVAKPILADAVAKYKAFKPASSLHPNWGGGYTEMLLASCDK